ncbi:MAG: hypothetical protein DMD91_25670 [Candidatus Rokuibacteriota bacterium]|nr:MAG: hypothetical protein DMD91_25670 [Candidatus Rokubacteria bacterium]
MSAGRPVTRPIVPSRSTPANALPENPPSAEITYKGYRIEPESYRVNSTSWSPRVVVSVSAGEGPGQRTPLYSTDAAKFSTRDEADRCALEVARKWIDAAVERPRSSDPEPA